MSPKRALGFVLFWIATAIAFGVTLYYWGSEITARLYPDHPFNGPELAAEFFTCYVIEWSLSVDNLFVFLMVFHSFGIERKHQRRALNWGIIGAVVLRMVFILLGLGLVTLFEPVMYVFGAILIYSGYQMMFKPEEEKDVRDNKVVKWVQKFIPITPEFHGDKFFVKHKTGLLATPLFLALVVIETFDVVFAVDSIPAAFAISRHPMVIFSANVFAILGLRSLYFILEHANNLFRFLRFGVAIVLAFVGVKMLIAHYFKIPTLLSLSVVMGVLFLSIMLSIFLKPKSESKPTE